MQTSPPDAKLSRIVNNTTTRPRVAVTRKLPDAVEARMSDLFDVSLRLDDTRMSQDELKAAIADCDVFVPTVTDNINADVIAAASSRLSLIANFGAGTDHIDVAAAHKCSLVVTNTPGVLTEDTADLAMAMILSIPRRLVEGDRRMRNGEFDGWGPTHMLGHRVRGKRLGILGMGRIGSAVARRAHAFGLSVHYHNRARVPATMERALDANWHETLEGMLAEIDILSINAPLTPSTRHLIDARTLALMKPDSYLVNTSRGEIVDEAALAEALAHGRLAGAGLDVYEDTPRPHPALLDLDNVILAPHIGSATHESRREMGEKVLINIRAHIDNHACPDRVLPPGTRLSLAS
ncbi:D-glycerate dehydrogenase [Algimonas arctica]|uniref:D-glycerate dehydrogenase n=1 Tax=Algimonas arctica TaxID=1479486 RepID=A0A8J3CT11_9PROT|nr:D-glycerate dehydrogenase [Algimonas arctica]GHA95111.1 D-glycerate dehydrogenase [Algimonas arctica]